MTWFLFFLKLSPLISNGFGGCLGLLFSTPPLRRRRTRRYLSQLEALRYLEVGTHYKRPRFPIWIIGSSSHFSVLFGDEAAIQESASDVLLEKVRRVFKGVEGGAEEHGFIQTHQLATFLHDVGLHQLSDHQVQTLAASMEAYGAGIILWEELWKKTSRLLTGASLQSVLLSQHDLEEEEEDDTSLTTTNTHSIVASLPMTMRTTATAGAAEGINEDDDRNGVPPMSDEELARKLQAEWNAEFVDVTGSSSMMTTTSSMMMTTTSQEGTLTSSASSDPSGQRYGKTFQLYHYNGLRGGNFTPFQVTPLNADDAIGASIPLSTPQQASHHLTTGIGGNLEHVLRTKW